MALRLSPAAMPGLLQGSLVSVVGGGESEELHRQASAGGPRLSAAECVPGRNHVYVLHEFADPSSWTHGLALELLGLENLQRVAPWR
jgi:arylformamidase